MQYVKSASVEIKNLHKYFASLKGNVEVFKSISLSVSPGEFFVLLGPSGCGKSTLLNCIAGLEKPSHGSIRIEEQVVVDTQQKIFIEPSARDTAMVFQSYALYPHMTVRGNIAFPLTNMKKRYSKTEIQEKVIETAHFLQIEHLLDRKPKELSGWQRQRVAIGRAIVRQPKLFLMDEPLSNLDAQLRMEMRAQLKELQRRLGVTTIYVTHDQMEAMTLGDRIAILHDGIIQQMGRPAEVYAHPANPFVAGFIGSPPMNLISGTLVEGEGTISISNQDGNFTLPFETVPAGSNSDKDSCIVGIRPEDIQIGKPGEGAIDVTVSVVENIGSEFLIYVFMKHGTQVIVKSSQKPADIDVSLIFPQEKIHFFSR